MRGESPKKRATSKPKTSSSTYDRALREARKKSPDQGKAFALLEQASAEGDARADYAIASWYIHGVHVRKNRNKALPYLERAAAANIPEAHFDLAVSLERGAGCEKNEKAAFEHLLRAALWGDKQAHYEVGRCYFHGIGTRKNLRLANIWLDRAKELEGTE